jgi:hypothetical protein
LKGGREQVEIIALYEELGSYRAVAALLGCDHKTVKRYVELAGELRSVRADQTAGAGDGRLPRADRRERWSRRAGGSRRGGFCDCSAPRATRVLSAR